MSNTAKTNNRRIRKQLAGAAQQLALYETMYRSATEHIDREFARQQEAGAETYIGREDFFVTSIAKAINEFKNEIAILEGQLS